MQTKHVVLSVIFIVAGAIAAYIGYGIVKNARSSVSWPTAKGKITVSKVVKKARTKGTGKKRRRSVTYTASISYSYQVDGIAHTARRVSFGEYSSGDSSHVEAIIDQYPVGAKVDVHYDPADPYMAVLEPGVSLSSYMVMGIGLLFLVVGVVMLFNMVSRRG